MSPTASCKGKIWPLHNVFTTFDTKFMGCFHEGKDVHASEANIKSYKTKSLENIHTRSKFFQSCAEFAWYQRCLGKTVLLLSPLGLVVFYPHCSTNVRFLRMCFQELGKPANNGIRYKLQLLYQNGKSHIL